MAALPSGLAAELPGVVADAIGASQFSDTNIWVVAEPLLSGGGCTVRFCARETTQEAHAFWSPTVVDTTGVKPAPLSALWASAYFCPVTSGPESATATALPARPTAATAALAPRTNPVQRIISPP
jgi:hypothetical protein